MGGHGSALAQGADWPLLRSTGHSAGSSLAPASPHKTRWTRAYTHTLTGRTQYWSMNAHSYTYADNAILFKSLAVAWPVGDAIPTTQNSGQANVPWLL